MGSIKKALKPITRVVDNIIPNEIKPALPYLAATFGAPYLAGSSLFGAKGILSALGQGALGRGVSASFINAATNAALGRKFNPVSAATSGIMAGGGFKLGESFPDSELAQSTAKFLSPGAAGDMTLGQVATATSAPITAGTTEAAFEEAEKANREYDAYVRQQEETGAADIQTRRDYITRYMGMAGFDQAQIDDALSRYGYKTGGRVGFAGGGTLGDSMQSMKILLMKNEIIESGKLGFDVKDIDTYSDDKIIEIYEGLFGQGKANGGRIGYRIGGGPVKSFIAKLLNAEPSEEVMQRMVEERKNEILNEMFDPEAGTGAYSMQQMQEADEMATKQAMKELEEYKMRIGMDLGDPPEGSVGDDVIDQIMGPREEGRVKEANGGRIGFKDGSNPLRNFRDSYEMIIGFPSDVLRKEQDLMMKLLDSDVFEKAKDKEEFKKVFYDEYAPTMKFLDNLSEEERKQALDKILEKEFLPTALPRDMRKDGGRIKKSIGGLAFMYKDYLEGANKYDIEPITFEEFTEQYLDVKREEGKADGGRIEYAEGGSSSTEQQKRENYFDLKRDEFMSLSEYLLSSMSDADLRSGKADGGIMNLNMGGMPAEMDLRGGGFVPLGAKEKADDVPARLSKNEFVMTANAVRAAGGGSVNKGAKKMYDLMNKLEARV